MKTKPRIGDTAWFVEWCYELGFHDEEETEVDRDTCKNRRRKVDTKEQAYSLAKEVWAKDDVANKLGHVEIWQATYRTWGSDEDAELHQSEGFWGEDGESDYYEGEEVEATFARRGFTLIELLVAISIVAFLLVAAGAAIVSVTKGTQLQAGANAVSSALSLAHSRAVLDSAIVRGAGYGAQSRGGTAGVRLLPDVKAFELSWRDDGTIDPDRPLAYDKIAPLYTPDSYSEGRVAIHPEGFPAGFVPPPGRLVLEEALYDESGARLSPTSWYWNIRVGDVVKVFNRPYTVVGPIKVGADRNPELYVNCGAPGVASPLNRGQGPAEFLYLSNRVDDNNDGWIDSGWDGIDNDLDGAIDELDEWEDEQWLGLLAKRGVVATNYTISRRPIADVNGAKPLPAGVVIDATTWAGYLVDDPDNPGEKIRIPKRLRSRLPVDPYTGAVDLLVDDKGIWSASSVYGRPTGRPMGTDALHFWVAPMENVLSPVQAKGEAKLVSVSFTNGRIQSSDADPADVGGTFARAEGEQR